MRTTIVALTIWLALPGGDATAQEWDELTLPMAVDRAFRAYPSLAEARAISGAAGARTGEALAGRLPQLSTQATLTRFEEPMVVAPFHAFDQAQPPQFDRTVILGNVRLTYTLFDGGTHGARISGARAQAGAAAAGVTATELDLVAEVTGAYLATLTARGTLDAQADGVAALTAERNRVRLLLDQGQAAQADLFRVEAALAQAEADRISADAGLDIALRWLARLIDVTPDALNAAGLAPVSLPTTGIETPRAVLWAQLEDANPSLEAARHRVDAARWARRATTAAWYPQLDIVGGYLVFGGAGNLTTEWQAGVRVSYPIFTGGARSHATRRSSAELAAAEARYRLARLRAADALDRALGAVAETHARIDAVGSAARHLEEVTRIERLALEAGAGTESDFLQAEAQWRETRAALVAARHAAIAARVQLARLTGVLSPAWIARTVETEQ